LVEFGISINSAITNRGTLTASIVGGSSQLANVTQDPVTISLPSSTYVLNIAGVSPPGAGNGSLISNLNNGCASPGTRIVRLRITNTVPYASYSTMNHVFNFVTMSGKIATKVK